MRRLPITSLSSLELCAGAGGQALGLELAGFQHAALVEIDAAACATLRQNRPQWDVREGDLHAFSGTEFRGIDLVAAGVPCPPFSVAGKQLGADDERDLFPVAIRIVREVNPAAVLLENVPGFASKKFEAYRTSLLEELRSMGYIPEWRVLQAANFGVPQLRPRFVLVALREPYADRFVWPEGSDPDTHVGSTLLDLMASAGWDGAEAWAERAQGVGPTIVGGSKKHGGADLGPTRAKQKWATLGVDGLGIADEPPGPEFPSNGMPRLTTRMVARLQGFPDEWIFAGRKTAAYRQVGNAFPPPVAHAVGSAIRAALTSAAADEPFAKVGEFGA